MFSNVDDFFKSHIDLLDKIELVEVENMSYVVKNDKFNVLFLMKQMKIFDVSQHEHKNYA